jgi:hypothetical protein
VWIEEDRLKKAINPSNLGRRPITPLLKGAALSHVIPGMDDQTARAMQDAPS